MKVIKIGDEARQSLKAGVDKVADLVGSSLGPRGRNTIIARSWGAPHITKDGVTIAREISLKDQFENMGAQTVKVAASKTCDEAGDGTTTATVLAQSIFNHGFKMLAAGFSPIDLKRGIDKATATVIEHLKSLSREVEGVEEVAQVGTISANGDREIGELLAKAVDKVGRDGIITVEEGDGQDTVLTFAEGVKFDRGYMTPHFITNLDSFQVEFEDACVLLNDGRLQDANVILPVLEAVHKKGKPILIIAEDFAQGVVATLIANRKNGLVSCPIRSPGFGDNRKEMMKDLAVLTGATLFSADLGNKLDDASWDDLGTVKLAVIDRNTTTLVSGGGTNEALKERIAQIRDALKHASNEYDKSKLQERLAKLVGGVAQIRVGGATEPEMKEKKDRVEDAMYATRAAVEEGIVTGGGMALLRCRNAVRALSGTLEAGEREGAKAVMEALESPARRIAENANGTSEGVVSEVLKSNDPNFGYNAQLNVFEDLAERGIIDPTKVVRCAIQNAASVASMLLTTEGMIGEEPKENE